MFGYVKALTPELKVKEYELYKSAYCGLCHKMRRRGLFVTFSLSYDFVLPTLFALNFTDKENITFSKKRCLAHPFKKRKIIDGGKDMQKVADAAILLLYYKLFDDKTDRDERFLKRLACSFALIFASSAKKKVLRTGSEMQSIDAVIKEKIASLSICEKEMHESVYDGANIFGELLSSVFEIVAKSESDKRCISQLGYHIGRWIYIADALDDIKKDRESGSYNPFVLSKVDTDSKEFKDDIEMSTRLELSESEKALSLINITDLGLKNIIENIFYIGMPSVISGILYNKDRKDKKSR